MPGEDAALRWVSEKSSHNGVSRRSYAAEFSYGRRVELGYARLSTAKQDLERQIEALTAVGITPERIYLDNKAGATVDRPGLRAVLGFARRGDVIVVHTLDRLGRTVRDTLHLIHELTERGAGVRNLADPTKVDSPDPADAMSTCRWCWWCCSPRWNGPTRASGRRTPGRWRRRTAGRWAGRACWTRPCWRTGCTCAPPGTRWPRSWPLPG